MYDYIKGAVAEIAPTEVIVENNGIGYRIFISLNTYSKIQSLSEIKMYIYHLVKEDDEQLFGFFDKEERNLFTLLISVSGVGVNTARMMLSSMSPDEIKEAIVAGDVNKIKSIKGIGLKSAQRLIIELKDKIVKGTGSSGGFLEGLSTNPKREEALGALVMLGFSKANTEKILDKVLKSTPEASLEEIIKIALKQL